MPPLQMVCAAGVPNASGIGFIEMVNVLLELTHPLLVAVRVIVATRTEFPMLLAVNEEISKGAIPSDPSANPIEEPPIQVNVSPPPVFALSPIGPTITPEQMPEMLLIKSTTGIGFTVVAIPAVVTLHPAAFVARTVTVWPFSKVVVV